MKKLAIFLVGCGVVGCLATGLKLENVAFKETSAGQAANAVEAADKTPLVKRLFAEADPQSPAASPEENMNRMESSDVTVETEESASEHDFVINAAVNVQATTDRGMGMKKLGKKYHSSKGTKLRQRVGKWFKKISECVGGDDCPSRKKAKTKFTIKVTNLKNRLAAISSTMEDAAFDFERPLGDLAQGVRAFAAKLPTPEQLGAMINVIKNEASIRWGEVAEYYRKVVSNIEDDVVEGAIELSKTKLAYLENLFEKEKAQLSKLEQIANEKATTAQEADV